MGAHVAGARLDRRLHQQQHRRALRVCDSLRVRAIIDVGASGLGEALQRRSALSATGDAR